MKTLEVMVKASDIVEIESTTSENHSAVRLRQATGDTVWLLVRGNAGELAREFELSCAEASK